MALTAEVKVNQETVAYVECRRLDACPARGRPDEPDDWNEYAVVLELPARGKGAAVITHRYGDGALVLLRKALEALT